MDWREMAGRPTVVEVPIAERLWAWRGGKKIGYGWTEDQWDGTMDQRRGWIIALCWIAACSAEYVSSSVHSRCEPRLILTKQYLLPLQTCSTTTAHPRFCFDADF